MGFSLTAVSAPPRRAARDIAAPHGFDYPLAIFEQRQVAARQSVGTSPVQPPFEEDSVPWKRFQLCQLPSDGVSGKST
jgi:hypothetical protein